MMRLDSKLVCAEVDAYVEQSCSRPRVTGRRSEAVADATRLQVAQAALRVFAARGFASATLRDIAAEAHVTHGLIRHHFGSKEGVWRAAVDYAAELSRKAIDPFAIDLSDLGVDPVWQAKTAIRATLDVFREHPEFVRLLMHEGLEGGAHLEYALGRFAPFGDMMAPLFQRLQAAGHLHQFSNRTLFLFILTAGAAPLALPALSAWFLENDVLSRADHEAHVERFLTTLLGDQRS